MTLPSHSNAAWVVVFALLSSTARAERLPLRVYTTADGLASSAILSIVPDSRGFLWFATRSGLSRFDGSEFRTYTTDDGLSHPVVNHLLETRDGEYWVATNGGGVCRFNVDRHLRGGPTSANGHDTRQEPLFACRTVGSDFLSNRVNVLYEDRQRRIWVGTDNGVFRLERGAGTWRVETVAIDGPAPAERFAGREIHEDTLGRLWIGSNRGVLRRDPDGHTRWYVVPARDVLAVRGIDEGDGALWIGSRFGLIAFRPEKEIEVTGRPQTTLNPRRACVALAGADISLPVAEGDSCVVDVTSGLPNNEVRALYRSPAGRLWIGTSGGLAYVDGRRLTSLATAEQVGRAHLDALAQDRDGHLWIGTTAGVMRMAVDGLVSYGTADGLGHPQIHSVVEDRDGTIFAVSGEWVVNRFEGGRLHAMHPRVPKDARFGYASRVAFLDRTNHWWLLTDRGLYRLTAGATVEQAAALPPEAVYTTRNGLAGARAYRLFEDSRGDIWIAAGSVPPAVFLTQWNRATAAIRQIPYPAGALPATVRLPVAFAEDRFGAVWVGFHDGALARYYEGQLRFFGLSDGAPPEIVDLHVDRSGRLWIASSSAGLSVLENPADRLDLRRYTTAQGLSTNSILCITDDEYGRIYLGSARGVDRLTPSTGRVKRLTTSDGLAGDYVTAALRDRSGALWFGTTDGLSRLVPAPDPTSIPPQVWIGEVRAGGRMHALSELGEPEVAVPTLGPAENHLQIAFFGVGFGTGGPLRYRYRLEGAQAGWTEPTDRRVVHYASLAPGRYRFVVEALNADGVASRQPASVSFTVLPPVWQRAWFVALAVLTLMAVAFAVHRVRVARILAVERVRSRLAADLHDDIGGSLSRIAIQSEVARRDLPEPATASARRLAEIGDTARAVVESLADVVWSVDPVQDDLASVERRVREYAADVLGPRGVRWTFHGTGHLDRFALGPEARRDLLLLLKEGITNIARHAEAKVASLHLRIVGGTLHAQLRDDGRGFLAAEAFEAKPGRGLANMRMRAEQLRGRITIASTPGNGTLLEVVVPLGARRRMNMRLWSGRQ